MNVIISKYMRRNVADHVDPKTGEVNATALAEDVCSQLNGYDGDEIPEVYFDCAEAVAIEYEIKTGVITGDVFGKLSGFVNSIPGGSL